MAVRSCPSCCPGGSASVGTQCAKRRGETVCLRRRRGGMALVARSGVDAFVATSAVHESRQRGPMKHARSHFTNAIRWSIAMLSAAALSACGSFPVECIRANQCVQSCGGPVLASGCAACATGTFDNSVCRNDAAVSDASDASMDAPADVSPTDAGPFSCGTQTCGASQICVQPCSGVDAGGTLAPFCTDAPAGCGATPTCGCLSPGVCPSASPPFPGCHQDGARHFTCSGCA